jgi:hypothetical protein
MSCIINGSAGLTTNSGAVYDGISRGTSVTASGTSVDFTSIPSWVKRITVMFSGVSTNGTSLIQARLGTSGGVVSTGYTGYYSYVTNAGATSAFASTTGFVLQSAFAGNDISGTITITNITGNTWVATVSCGSAIATVTLQGGGNVALSGTLDRIRITTGNGTDTFDAGSINILFE